MRGAESVRARADKRNIGIAFAMIAGGVALSVLVFGWWVGIDTARRIHPDWPAMVPSTAADILIGCIGALGLLFRGPRWITIAAAIGIILVTIAAIFLPVVPAGSRGSDGMSVASALAAVFLALSLSLRAVEAYAMAIIVTTLALSLVSICVIGYVFDAQDIFDNPIYTKMALHTALAYLSLYVALLLSRSDRGWIGVLFAPETGSQMARRVLPVVASATLVLCLMAKRAVDRDIMSADFRIAILTYLIIAAIAVAVIGYAHLANQSERRSIAAEAAYLQSERRRQDMELATARAQKVEALGQLVAGVAHDFNNTLNVILGNLELLKVDPSSENRETYLREATSASNRAAHLTHQLLAYGQKSRLTPGFVKIEEALEPSLTMFRRVCPSSIEIVRDLAFQGAVVKLDGVAFQQAVLNVLINARDAIGTTGRITLIGRTEQLAAQDISGIGGKDLLYPGVYATLTVRDSGAGMDPETLRRATEPFFTTKKFGSGTGLGLSTVSGFCRQSGGGLRIESRPGEGTDVTFVFRLAEEFRLKDPVSEDFGGARAECRGILIVDDDEAVHRVIASQLELDGHDVRVASNGEAALELLREGPLPELVLADIIMPGPIQGYDLAERIRQRFPEIKVLLMSGYDSAANRERLASLGDTPFLQKPINLRTLRTAVGRLLPVRQAEPGDVTGLSG